MTTELQVFDLAFRSGLHIGVRGVNLEETGVIVPSDTLFAALVDAYRRAGGDPDAWIVHFPRRTSAGITEGAAPFVLTSAFPYAGDVRFFPMPVRIDGLFSREVLDERRKLIKRIRFVSEGLFRRILAGKRLDDVLFPADPTDPVTSGVGLQEGTLWLSADEIADLPPAIRPPRGREHALRRQEVYAQQQVPRVTVERVGSASDIYHVGRTTFAEGCGLWFGVAWREAEPTLPNGACWREAFRTALGLLADDGLGGERAAGYGAFEVAREGTLKLPAPTAGGIGLLLSRYHPREAELPDSLDGPGTAYQLVAVGGWLRSWDGAAQRRKRLWMVEAGSTIRMPEDGQCGGVVDVRPEYEASETRFPHPVWRAGLGLAVGMQEVIRG